MNIAPILQSIGLTEKEAKVYAAILELGTATILKISQKAELKRPTGGKRPATQRLGEYGARQQNHTLHC